MKTRSFGIVAALALSFVAASLAPTAAHARELDPGLLRLLKGTWKVVTIHEDRKPPSAEELKAMKIVIDGSKLTFVVAKDKAEEATISRGDSPESNAMDIHCGSEVRKAIFYLTGDGLKICYDRTAGAERPKEFPPAGETPKNLTVIVLERPTE